MSSPFSKELEEHILNGGFIDCAHIHPNSCEVNAINKFIKTMGIAFKFYLPVHGIPTLIFKRKQLKEKYIY